MAKSSARGTNISVETQVLGLTPNALWLLVGDRELMLDFVRYPWFSRATMEEICDAANRAKRHFAGVKGSSPNMPLRQVMTVISRRALPQR